ncbi:MAG: hypothetical protein ABFR47_04100 [Verrucomicrobiota bacterium]
MHSGKVPMFKMKPQSGTLWLAIAIFILGVAIFYDGHRDPADISAHGRSNLILAVSVVVGGIMLIISTGRMWFKHLHHDRYKRHRTNSRRQ